MSTSEYTDADRAEYQADIDAIATDPTLTPDEKTEAMNDRYQEELDAIDAAFGTDAAADSADAAAPTDAAAPADTDVAADPVEATDSATTDDASVATEVPAEAAAQNDSLPPVDSGSVDAESAPTYYSARDVDADGDVDVIHQTVDGVTTITHVDENGDITLVEADTDGNGTYETAATGVRDDGTVRVAEDLDDDGAVDLATFLDPSTGSPVRQDLVEGDRITDTLLDTDGDGAPDTHLVDADGDGRFDTVELDTDGDGIVNENLVDTDGDGSFDVYTADADYTGDMETTVTADEVEGGIGDVSAYEALVPEGDHYHDQVDTYADTEPAPVVVDDAV